MKNQAKKAKMYFSLGFLAAGAAVGVGAALMAVLKQQKGEKVYHEAELKAMNELDDLMAENESACAGCTAGDNACCAEEQISISEDPAEEAAPAEQAADAADGQPAAEGPAADAAPAEERPQQ